MAINDILDKIITVLSAGLPTVNISVGDPRQDPPAQCPHINIYNIRTTYADKRVIHSILLGIGVKDPTIDIVGKVIKYKGFFACLELIATVKQVLLLKSQLLRLEFYDETIDSVDLHGIYASKLTVVCQEIIPSKGHNQ